MPSSIIGALRVTLGLDSANFEAGAKRARNEATRTAGSIKTAFGGISSALSGFVAGIGVAGVIAAAKAGLEYASSLGEVAKQLGVTSDDLQIYRAVGKEVGITQEEMDKGLSRLSRTLGQLRDNNPAVIKTFKDLGFEGERLRDMAGRTAGQAIPLLADAFNRLKNPTDQARLAFELWGKAGQRQLTLLALGSKGINDLADAYRKFGAVLTPQQIKQADEAADTLQRLKTILAANIASVVADNAGSIVILANALVKLGTSGKFAHDNASGIIELFARKGFLAGTAEYLKSSADDLDKWGTAVGRFQLARKNLAETEAAVDRAVRGAARQSPDDRRATLRRQAAILHGASAEFRAANEELRSSIRGKLGPKVGNEIADPNAALPQVAEKAKKAKKEVDLLSKAIEEFNGSLLDFKTVDLSDIQRQLDSKRSQEDEYSGMAAVRDQIKAKAEAELDAAEEVARHKHELEQNNIQQLAGLYQSLFTGGTKGFLETLRSLGIQIISELAAKWTLGMGGAGGGGIVGSLLGGIGKLFGGGGGGGGIMPSLPAFASGGSFRVGGSGAIDSQLVAFRATPGEMVDVRKPGNDNYQRGGNTYNFSGNLLTPDFWQTIKSMDDQAAQRGGAIGIQAMDRRDRFRMGKR